MSTWSPDAVKEIASFTNDSTRTFAASRKKAVWLFLGSLCFIALGVWISSEKPWLGWITVAFSTLGIPASFAMFLPGAMYLKLDAEGFELKSLFNTHRTKWTDVAGFRIGTLHHNRMIAIVYHPSYQRQKLGRALASSLAGMEGAIPNSYNASLDEILQSLDMWKSRFG